MTFVLILVVSIVTGFIAEIVASKKNISGFWWGFWLNFLGVIIVCCLPEEKEKTNKINGVNIDKYKKLEQLSELKENGTLTKKEFEKEKKKILESDN